MRYPIPRPTCIRRGEQSWIIRAGGGKREKVKADSMEIRRQWPVLWRYKVSALKLIIQPAGKFSNI